MNGYCVFYMAMLDYSVLFYGNDWLLDGGLMFQDIVTFHGSAIEDLDYQTKNGELFDNSYRELYVFKNLLSYKI